MQTVATMSPGTAPGTMPLNAARDGGEILLTLFLAGQLCGVPVRCVRDVLGPQPLTRIPLAPPEVAGGLNLRGRIVTALDLRRRLDLPPRAAADGPPMAVVVEQGAELYALLCDTVGEVVELASRDFVAAPPTLDAQWRALSRGVHRRLDGASRAAGGGRHGAGRDEAGDGLLVLLDVERVLSLD